ncbi:amino acid ABC transporter substrate-binding protein [Lampropedia puyangensis]|uniref:Amino acid ABC transporter substrate-binding protein n=1 Tax=Lampropedia puyangensis TaxID=1330072 RepID=A0A4S8FBY1_9BURK|nr:amino acid ABC transporter substrate-binding protein [Lampropedia puyangensis]THU05158.1 amino acid ABC transporter substrate-binding protein [Lampropedia puyangensis]
MKLTSLSLSAVVLATASLLSTGAVAQEAGATVAAIKKRGELVCGVSQGSAGLSLADKNGQWHGLDVDVCKALATATLGSPDKVRYVPLSSQQRFPALQNGEIDVLSRNTTITSGRDSGIKITAPAIVFYDGQGFMVPKKLGITSAKDLNGAQVCVQPGTNNEQNLVDWFTAHKLEYKPVVIENLVELEKAFYAGRCDVYLSDKSTLAASRSARADNPDDFVILPENINKSPLGPWVRDNDSNWIAIVKWTVNALVAAEELGISSSNVDSFAQSKDPQVRRLLGLDAGIGKSFGLDEKWIYNIIKNVGHYGEIWERNVGLKTPIKLERGLNAQWSQGGLLYAPPFQ